MGPGLEPDAREPGADGAPCVRGGAQPSGYRLRSSFIRSRALCGGVAAACEPLPPCAGEPVAEPLQTFAVSPPAMVCAVAPYRPSEIVMPRLDRQAPVTLAAVVCPGHTRCPAGACVFAMPSISSESAVRYGEGTRNPAEFPDSSIYPAKCARRLSSC